MVAAIRVRCALRRVALALLLGLPLAAGASPFMDGTTADVWVVDPETGRVTGYDFSQWVESFAPAGAPLINLGGAERALVNSLPGSSEIADPRPACDLAHRHRRARPGRLGRRRAARAAARPAGRRL
jgi:hypothetical protein